MHSAFAHVEFLCAHRRAAFCIASYSHGSIVRGLVDENTPMSWYDPNRLQFGERTVTRIAREESGQALVYCSNFSSLPYSLSPLRAELTEADFYTTAGWGEQRQGPLRHQQGSREQCWVYV